MTWQKLGSSQQRRAKGRSKNPARSPFEAEARVRTRFGGAAKSPGKDLSRSKVRLRRGRREPSSCFGRAHAGAMRVGMAASAEFLGLDDSWPPLRSAMTDLGLEPEVRCWEDSDADWEHFALVVAMYTWGYVTRRHEFLAWTKRIEALTTLVNSAAHIQWNSHKSYLQDLSAMGVPVVPTSWVRPGEPWSPPAADYVVKPCVASGGLGAARYRDSSWHLAEAHVRRLHEAGHTAMVQPYQHTVDTSGETAVVFIGDHISHAVQKSALLVADAGEADRLWEREVICPIEATSEQRQVATAALAAAVDRLGPTAYARVDLVDDYRGGAQVLELELIEPSLFLTAAEGSAGRLAEVLHGLARQQAAGSAPRPLTPGN